MTKVSVKAIIPNWLVQTPRWVIMFSVQIWLGCPEKWFSFAFKFGYALYLHCWVVFVVTVKDDRSFTLLNLHNQSENFSNMTLNFFAFCSSTESVSLCFRLLLTVFVAARSLKILGSVEWCYKWHAILCVFCLVRNTEIVKC